jgi:hypothetical protein
VAQTPEGKVKAKVKALLKKLGIWSFMPVAGPFSPHGIPDFICCVPTVITPEMVGQKVGLFVAIETKAPGKIKNTTPNQERVIEEINDHGGTAVVVDDVSQLGGVSRWLT